QRAAPDYIQNDSHSSGSSLVNTNLADTVIHYFFFVNATATTEIYTLSLHDALPISGADRRLAPGDVVLLDLWAGPGRGSPHRERSEEHTSELQSPYDLVCRLLLEKKKQYEKDRFD